MKLHVVPYGGVWAIREDNCDRIMQLESTKGKAIKLAKSKAKGYNIVVHDKKAQTIKKSGKVDIYIKGLEGCTKQFKRYIGDFEGETVPIEGQEVNIGGTNYLVICDVVNHKEATIHLTVENV